MSLDRRSHTDYHGVMAKTPTSVRLSEEQSDALAKIAERDERTQSWLISKAIDEYIERQLGKGRSTNN